MTVSAFIHETTWQQLSEPVRRQARRCLLDTIGAGVAGRCTELSGIIHDFATRHHGGRGAHLWLDGRELSPPGAALANGMTIDALDIHDGYSRAKGHAGAAVVPATIATLALGPDDLLPGSELLATLVVGYEVALRAGEALHSTACDYHTSGAWNALGCAAVTARRLGLDSEHTQHALGIAEYHGPRSPMMRCIDHPTMVKDGSGWGAMTGVSAGLMAGAGFTGAPAATVTEPATAALWEDLGSRWCILELYFKPHAVCRWGQPAISAAQILVRAHQIVPEAIKELRVFTFAEATRLSCQRPETTEEAQYSLPFPLAAALVHGRLGPAELSGAALRDERVLRLAERVTLVETAAFNAHFPERRYARVEIETGDGVAVTSGDVEPPWDDQDPPDDAELLEKFRWLAGMTLTPQRASHLEQLLWQCEQLDDSRELLAALVSESHLLAATLEVDHGIS
jgi:2-methylcitrate dehydratase PrpD